MILRKLIRQGNSIVVAIPSNILEAMKLRPGDHIGLDFVPSPRTQPLDHYPHLVMVKLPKS